MGRGTMAHERGESGVSERRQPVRTCIGCRQRAPRSALVRIVRSSSRVVVDERGALAGRGAWLHPSRDCLNQAHHRRAWGRALRHAQRLDTTAVDEWFDTTAKFPGPQPGQRPNRDEGGLESDGHPMRPQR